MTAVSVRLSERFLPAREDAVGSLVRRSKTTSIVERSYSSGRTETNNVSLWAGKQVAPL